MKILLFTLTLIASFTASASADDVNCNTAAQQLVTHFAKDFKKVFNKEIPANEMSPFFLKMCEAGKTDANKQFREGNYNVTSAAMGNDFQSAMMLGKVDENMKPMIKQYASVAYMYGYVNWFVN